MPILIPADGDELRWTSSSRDMVTCQIPEKGDELAEPRHHRLVASVNRLSWIAERHGIAKFSSPSAKSSWNVRPIVDVVSQPPFYQVALDSVLLERHTRYLMKYGEWAIPECSLTLDRVC